MMTWRITCRTKVARCKESKSRCKPKSSHHYVSYVIIATAVSAFSKFFSSFVASKLPPPPPPNDISFPSPTSLKLPKTGSTEFAPLVTTCVPKPSKDADITSIVWPSMANANILFFFNVQIKVADDDPEENILKRFRSAVLRAGIIQECKRRRFFESTRDKKKRKARSAAQRNRKRRPQPRTPAKHEAPKKNEDDDEDDNWEVPDVDIPYCNF